MTEQSICRFAAAPLLALLLTGCASKAFYYPDHHVYATPANDGLAYEEVSFSSADGTTLNGWFIPSATKAKGTVIHFHGNAQNISSHYSFVSWLPKEGFNVFTFDYRGYGKSGGSVSRSGIREDAEATLNYVRSRRDVDPARILVLGQSLGCAISLAALTDAGTNGIRAVVLDSPFYSYRSIVRDKMKLIPVVGLLRWPLSFLVISNSGSPASTVDDLSPIPLLILHGTSDQVIPYSHGARLFAKAEEPKQMLSIPRGRHADALTLNDPQYRQQVVLFFNNALSAER